MSKLVLPLEQVSLTEAAIVGKKAAALGALLAAGFPVPPGICISTGAFHLALAPLGEGLQSILQRGDLSGYQAAAEVSHKISALLAELGLPQGLADELDTALAENQAISFPLAVRSSAIHEGGEKASFAGQYLTQIGVRDRAELHQAVLACWRSFFSPNALFARSRMGAPEIDDAMAVLVQPVIPAETSGVCLTLDPVHPDNDQAFIAAAWGLGVGVVEGAVAADTARLSRSSRASLQVEERIVVEKYEQFSLDAAGGLQKQPMSAERIEAACLPEGWLRRIAEFGISAELFFGSPQELEWAIAGEQVWILQSRPITALRPGVKKSAFPVDWDELRKSELFWQMVPLTTGQPLLPVEWDYTEAGAKAKEDAGYFTGEDRVIRVQFFNGRPYFTIIPSQLSPGDRRIRQRWLANLKQRLYTEGKTAWEYWGPEVIATVEQFAAFDLQGSEDAALAGHLEETLAAIRLHWMIHSQLWPYFQWQLRQSLREAAHLTESEAQTASEKLLQGEENALTRLVDGLYELGETARRSARLAAVVEAPPADPRAALERLEAEAQSPEKEEVSAFRRQFESFLQLYGDRTGKGFGSESTLLTPAWREMPELALRLVSPYLDPASEPPAEARQRAQRSRDAWVAELLAGCEPEQAADFRRKLDQARREGAILEDHNHYIDQMSSGQLRAALLEAGRRLVKQGKLSELEDVYWLRVAEVAAQLRSPSSHSLAAIVAQRKEQHRKWEEMYAPLFIGIPAGIPAASLDERPPLAPALTQKADANNPACITGQGASPGCRQGRARVVQNSTILPKLQSGDILVAENAGPLWTPFFPILGGLVLEHGTMGQHAAATAREYGVPAVIGAANATRRIPDGAWVLVDGEAGTVELLLEKKV